MYIADISIFNWYLESLHQNYGTSMMLLGWATSCLTMSRYSVHCDTLDLIAPNLARGFLIRSIHDDVIKWKHIPRYWPFVRGIHRSPVNFPHNGRWCGALEFSLIRAWRNGWVNNPSAGDLGRHRAHYDVIVTSSVVFCFLGSSGDKICEQMCWHYQTCHDKRDTTFKLLDEDETRPSAKRNVSNHWFE